MSQSRDRYEPDDELYQREASVHIERLDDNGFYVGVTGADGTYYWMRFHSESPITWTVEKHEPEWCRMTGRGPGCRSCWELWREGLDEFPMSRFIVCPDCGNKRCPKATWHGYKCTGSNDTGQECEWEPVIVPPSDGPVFDTPEWQKKNAEAAEHFAKLINKETG